MILKSCARLSEERKFRAAFSAKQSVGIDLLMRQHKFAAMATIVSFKIASFPKQETTLQPFPLSTQEPASYQQGGK